MSRDLDRLVERAAEKRRTWKLKYFLEENPPYWYQQAFWEAGLTYFVRMSFAGNQTGKTTTDAIEMALHATGRYDLFPGGWRGHRCRKPPLAYLLGPTTDSVRDNLQYHLLGPSGDPGTGFIPKELIKDVKYRHSSAGTADTIFVRWSGPDGQTGVSELRVKSYDMGVKAVAGATADLVATEEHGEISVWNEMQMRLIARGGRIFGSCTPVQTKSAADNEWLRMIRKKAENPQASIFFITYGQYEARHLSREMIDTLAANMKDEAELLARRDGVLNMFGAGLVFPINESDLIAEPGRDMPLEIPGHWRRVAGIDFGTTDGTALIWMAEDPQNGRMYIYDEDYFTTDKGYTGGFMFTVAQAIFRRGRDIPVVWPHDGSRHAEGMTLADGYRALGVRMAQDPINRFDANVGGGLVRMLTALQSGQLKVHPRCRGWLDERASYMWADDGHGAKKKQMDHRIDASRYAFMGMQSEGITLADYGFTRYDAQDQRCYGGESFGEW